MANRIMLNETSYHGAGAIQEIAAEAKARAFKKAFVCSDPDLIKFGVTGKVTDVLDKAGLAYEIYSDIKANPTIEKCTEWCCRIQSCQSRLHCCNWRRFFYGYRKGNRYYHCKSGI